MKRFIYNMLILLIYIPFLILIPLMIIAYIIADSVIRTIGKDVNLYGCISEFLNVLSNMTDKLR